IASHLVACEPSYDVSSEIDSGCLARADFSLVFRDADLERVDVPPNYDWRYRVISNLLSPRDNPAHYWLAAIGLALTALLMLPFARHLRRHLEVASPRVARMSSGAFVAGSIALICAWFIVPQHVHYGFGGRRLHEFFGRSAWGFLTIGMLCGCWCAWKGC